MEVAHSEAKVDGVRVAVRVRPLNAREKARAADSPLNWRVGQTEIAQSCSGRPVPANTFSFDHVFNEKSTNAEVFENLAQPLVAAALEGYNATVFAYGQTSSGKTHSMLGSDEDPGVTRQSIAEVFARVRATTDRQFLLRASYIEIYQEVIRDLLDPSHDNLKIHEDLNRRVYVEAREEVVSSVEQVMAMIAEGESVRAVGETNMNDRSSRSHTIFTLLIESREARPSDVADPAIVPVGEDGAPMEQVSDGIAVRASTLSLVDLAGSERAALTGAEGVRLKEGSHINKSLLTLGNVINKLSSAEPAATAHIPYRDSKLTRILQPALGGNARTAILCAVTPAIMHMEETLSTLKFASRAKKVKNRTQCNEYLDDTAKLRRCERQLEALKKQLAAAQASCFAGAVGDDLSEDAVQAATARRIHAFQLCFANMANEEQRPRKPTRRRPSSRQPRDALDLAIRPLQNDNESTSAFLSANAETQIAGMRRSVFAAEQKQACLNAEIEYERKAMIAEVEMLSEAAEDANRSRSAAEDECSVARTELAKAHSSALVDEMISTSMLCSASKQILREAEARIRYLEQLQGKAVAAQDKLVATEKELQELRKREKRGVGPVLKEVQVLTAKLADCENKLKCNKQTSTKTASEKAALEKEMMAKERQVKLLETELQKHRKHDTMSNTRAGKEIAAERQKLEELREEKDTAIILLGHRLQTVEEEADELRSTVATLEEDKSTLIDERTRLECEIATRKDDLASVEQRVRDGAAELEAAQEELASVQEAHSDAEAVSKEKMDVLKEAVQARDSSLSNMKAQADELGTELASLHMATETVKAEYSEAQRLLEEAEASASASQDTIAALQSEVNELTAKVASLEEKVASARKDMAAMSAKNSSLESDLSAALSEAEVLSTAASESEAQLLLSQEKLKSRESDLDLMRREREDAQNRVADLVERIKVMETSSRAACAKMTSQMDEMKAIHKMASEDLKTQKDEVRKARESFEKQNERLSAQVAKESEHASMLLEKVYNRDSRVSELQGKLDEYRRSGGAIRRLEQKLQRRDATLEQLRSVLDANMALINQAGLTDQWAVARRAAAAEAELKTLKAEMKDHAEEVARLENREAAGQEERQKLRQEIKARDLAKQKERSERLQDALLEKDLNV
jgi:centromeric protein E